MPSDDQTLALPPPGNGSSPAPPPVNPEAAICAAPPAKSDTTFIEANGPAVSPPALSSEATLPPPGAASEATAQILPAPAGDGATINLRGPKSAPPPNDASLAAVAHVAASDRTLAESPAEGATMLPSEGEGTWVDPAAGAPAAPGAPPKLVIDDYEVLGELGRGGMGVVYKARHRRLNRVVALKMILSGTHASASEQGRFIAEAEAVASIQHPNIVQIFDIGRHEGRPYFTLEFVEGGSLTDRVKEAPLAAREAAEVVQKLARAMQAAHERGIVHRDLKPDNVLMSAAGEPKVTDFGLARKVEGGSGMTQTGAIMGTPSYMAPEQAGGKTKEAGPAADIYALGAVLYRLVTGRPPFQAATPLETVMQVVGREPLAPSRLMPGLPRDLETICLKCLHKEPVRRYATSADLAEDLRRFLAGEPIAARPVRPWERWIKWARRHPAAAALLLVGTLAMAGGTAFFINSELEQRRRVDAARAQAGDLLAKGREAMARSDWESARLQFERAREAAEAEPEVRGEFAEVDALTEQAQGRLRAGAALAAFAGLRDEALLHAARTVGSGSRDQQRLAVRKLTAAVDALPSGLEPAESAEVAASRYELLLVLAEATGQRLNGEPATEQAGRLAEASKVMDRAAALGFGGHPTPAFYLRKARYLEALGRADEAKIERAAAAARQPASALDYYLLGDERYRVGDVGGAESAFESALRLEPRHFWARYFLALCEVRQDRPDLARAHLTACLSQRADHATRAWVYLMRGYAQGQLGRQRPEELPAAERDFEEALRELKSAGGDAEAEYALFNNRGVMRVQNRQFDSGVADLAEAIRLNPRQYHARVSLATAYQQTHRLDEAAAELGRAVDVAKQLLATHELEPAALAALYRHRAQVHLERYQERGRRAGILSIGAPPVVAVADLAVVFSAMNESADAARADLEQAVAALEQAGAEPLARSKALGQLGRLFQTTQRYREAAATFDRAATLSPDYADAWRWKAQSLLRLSRHAAAEVAFTAYLEVCRRQGTLPAADSVRARAFARERLGRFEDAADDYSRALALEPKGENGATYVQRGRAYLAAGKPQLAVLDFDEADRRKALDAEGFAVRGYARARLARFDEALADAEAAMQRGPRTPTLLLAAARTFALAAAGFGSEAGQPQADRILPSAIRCLELLEEALETAGTGRIALWRDGVRLDGTLGPVRATPRFRALDQKLTPLMFEAADRAGRASDVPAEELLDAARTLAQAAEHPPAASRKPAEKPEPYRERAAELIRRAVLAIPKADRGAYWTATVEPDPGLATLRGAPEFDRLRELGGDVPK